MDKAKYRRFGWAVYLFVAALAIILFLLAFRVVDELYKGLLLGLAVQLLGVAFLFFLLQFFQQDPGEVLEEKIELRLGKMTELQEKIDERIKGDIDIFPTRQSIWDASLNIIARSQWDKVRIFAPVGLWRPDKSKAEWLKQIALCADETSLRVGTIWAVYGLPPKSRYGEERGAGEIIKDLQYFREVLNVFKNLKNVELHYSPPTHSSIGLGALIIENRALTGGIVAFAMASHGHEEVVDAGFGVNTQQELFFLARAWFDDKIFRKATAKFILHDVEKSIEERWPSIVHRWYPELATNYQSTLSKVATHSDNF